MLTRIQNNSYERCYPKRLKRLFRANINYNTYEQFIPNMTRAIVGNLPPEIINLFTYNKANRIKYFQCALAGLANTIRKNNHSMEKDVVKLFDNDIYSPEKIKVCEKKYTDEFNEKVKKLIPKGYKFELKYIDHGGYANVFRLSLYNEKKEKIMHDKALKVFFNIDFNFKEYKPYFGNYAEANFWTFIKYISVHSLDKTEFTKHYISDMKSGYSLTEFIDENIHPTTQPLNFRKNLKIFYGDYKNNKPILKKLYDAGGMSKDKDFIEDPIIRKYYKKLRNRNSEKDLAIYLESLNKKIQNPKTPNRNKIIKAIEIFQNDKINEQLNNKKFNRFINKFKKAYKNLKETINSWMSKI